MSKDVAVFAKGTKLEMGDGETPEVFTEIKGITKWSPDAGGAGEPEKLDVTSGSTVGLVREKIDGFSDKRPGNVGIELFYDHSNAQHAALQQAGSDGTDHNFQLTIPTHAGTEIATFTARVNGFPADIPFDKTVTVRTTLAVKEDSWVWL